MLSRVKIQNFKSIGELGVDLELKPLTFLVGPNGSGKSSIMEAIGVTAQGAPSGQSANLPSWKDMLHKPDDSAARISVFDDIDPSSGSESGLLIQLNVGGVTNRHQIPSERRSAIDQWVSQNFTPKTFLIASTRGNIPYTTDTSAEPRWVGIHGQHLLLLLARILNRREYDDIVDRIVQWASRFGVEGLRAGLWGSNTAGSDTEIAN